MPNGFWLSPSHSLEIFNTFHSTELLHISMIFLDYFIFSPCFRVVIIFHVCFSINIYIWFCFILTCHIILISSWLEMSILFQTSFFLSFSASHKYFYFVIFSFCSAKLDNPVDKFEDCITFWNWNNNLQEGDVFNALISYFFSNLRYEQTGIMYNINNILRFNSQCHDINQ